MNYKKAIYYFPKGAQLLVLSLILLPVLTIILLEYYKIMIGFVVTGFMIFIPFGILLALAFFVTQAPFKIHLWVLYIGFIFLLTVISEAMIYGMQIQDSVQRSSIIIEALEKYKKDKGTYPKKLEALKGKYLGQIPATAIGVFSTQEYYYGSDNDKFELLIYDHFLNLGGVHLYGSDHPERGWYYDD